jgi:Rha family phage regulatory protein
MSNALVSLVNGIPTTTSQKVAEVFGKRHDNVIRNIRDLMDKCPKEFNALNFEAVEYTDPKGEKRTMYLLTRDGLTLLVMGYTGKEAMRFKLAYIEAFNCMERQLQAVREIPAESLSIEGRRPLSNLIGQWAGKAKLSFPDCWRELHAVFNISTVAELPASQLPAALAWVQAKIDALSPSVPSAVPTVSPSVPTELAAYGHRKNFWKDLEDARAKLGSISSAIDITLPQSRSLGDRQNAVLCDTLSANVQVAHNCLVVAQQALKAALSLKKELAIA